jgi:hypothetical protein
METTSPTTAPTLVGERRGALADREEEERRLPPFPQDGEEDDGGEAHGGAGRDGAGELGLELFLDVHRLLAHPEDHLRQHGDRREHGHAVEDLLRPTRELGDR